MFSLVASFKITQQITNAYCCGLPAMRYTSLSPTFAPLHTFTGFSKSQGDVEQKRLGEKEAKRLKKARKNGDRKEAKKERKCSEGAGDGGNNAVGLLNNSRSLRRDCCHVCAVDIQITIRRIWFI